MIQPLEVTHPQLATFLQGVAQKKAPYGVTSVNGLVFRNRYGSIVRQAKEPGRNSLRLCRSGKKYKKCCKGG